MLAGPSRTAAARWAATSQARAFASTTATPLNYDQSATSSNQQQQPPRHDPHRRLVNRIVKVAVRGSAENSSDPGQAASPTPPSGYKPAKRRPTPPPKELWNVRAGQSGRHDRGKLVAYDRERLEQNLRPKSAPSGPAPSRRRSGPVRHFYSPSVISPDAVARSSVASSRNMSSSSRVQRIRLDESSLNSADESVGGGDGGGLWDDAEAGDGFSSGAASKPRELRPGDWVDTSRNGQLLCGIYICRSLATVRRLTVLASSGELVDVSLDDVIATVPSLVPASAPKRLTDYLAQYVEAREASTPSSTEAQSAPVVAEFPETLDMLQALRALEVDIERETQTLAAHGVHDIYRVVVAASRALRSAAASAGGAVSVTVGSALAALRIPGKATRPRALALTRILLSQPQHFIADPLTLRHTARFDLRPLEEVERFETVRGWIRERTVEVERWAEKCARVRQWAREQRSSRSDDDHAHLSLVDLPSDDPTFAWTPTDRTIFDFLRDTLARERLLQVQPHLALAPSLIKLVDAASAHLGLPEWEQTREVQRLRIREFLAEVGVVAEWEDWAAHEKRTGLQTWDEAGDKVGEKVARARETTSSPARNDYYPSDPHDAVRHDFGSAAVYTIDDPGASELDDGISLVKGPPTSDGAATWWVHVHIADPTALLHPSHPLTNLARHRDHTVYFPEYIWPMLPDSFTVGEKLSLGANGQEGQRVLSLGSRIVESTGEVVETEVKAGVVREVRRLTYAAVDQALGYSAPRNGRTIENRAATSAEVEAEAMRTKRPTDDAALPNDPNAVAELGVLQRLAKKLMRRRVDSSALFWQFPSSSVSVAPKPLRPHFETGTQPMFFSRSPHVSVRLPHPDDHSYVNSPAHLLVSEMMVAANRAAARFAVERGIAVPFRQQGAPTASPEALDAIMNLRDPDSGIAPATEVLKRRLEFLPGETTPTAGPHWPMGIDDEYGYLRVTSPLRRYSDLYSHYQLKSALLPSNSSSSFAPRAGLSAVMTQIEGFNAAAKARHRLDGAAQAFWSLWVIKQKFDLLQLATAGSSSLPALGEADHITLDLLANGLTALAYRQPAHSSVQNLYIQAVLIPQLGIRGSLRLDKPEHGAEVGEEVPVQIEDITLGPRSKIVVALRS